MKLKRPRIILACVADHALRERAARAIEFVFPDGSGGVLTFYTLRDGTNVVETVDLAPGIVVYGIGTSVTALLREDAAGKSA